MLTATNDEIGMKLVTEKESYDTLLSDKMVLEETCKRKVEDLEEDTEIVTEQDLLLAELKKQVEAEQALVDALEETTATAKLV